MSDQTKNQNESKELRIEDLPPKPAKPEEEDSTKGGYYSGGGLSGVGILQETLPKMTTDSSGNEVVDNS